MKWSRTQRRAAKEPAGSILPLKAEALTSFSLPRSRRPAPATPENPRDQRDQGAPDGGRGG